VLEIASEGLFCTAGEGGANPSLRHSRASPSGAQGATRESMSEHRGRPPAVQNRRPFRTSPRCRYFSGMDSRVSAPYRPEMTKPGPRLILMSRAN
jgi:hypothetical protein